MPKRTPENPIFFDDQELETGDVQQAINAFFESKKLEPEKEKELRDWYKSEVKRMVTRKRMLDNRSPSRSFVDAALNHVLAKLELLAGQIITAKERNEERLNPFMLSKSGLRKETDVALTRMREQERGVKKLLVLVNVDLDDFKIINDTHGHGAGDEVLKSVGRAISFSVRPDDSTSHYSGDEFGILLPMSFPDAMSEEEIKDKVNEIVSRIVSKIQQLTKRPDGRTQELSVGYRLIKPDEKGDFEDFHKDADVAAELSKIMRIVEEEKAGAISSPDRALEFGEVKNLIERYTREDLARARAIRNMKRHLNELFPNMPADHLRRELEKFVRSIELGNVN